MSALSPSHSSSRDRQREILFCQGSSLAEISHSSTFMISLRSLGKEKYPLWTPLKRKEKPRQARENLCGPVRDCYETRIRRSDLNGNEKTRPFGRALRVFGNFFTCLCSLPQSISGLWPSRHLGSLSPRRRAGPSGRVTASHPCAGLGHRGTCPRTPS
jgi:hypothetical protein